MNPSSQSSELTARLAPFRSAGILSDLDYHLAIALARRGGDFCPEVALAAAFASRAVRAGHVCVDLRQLSDADLSQQVTEGEPPKLPQRDLWLRLLQSSALVGQSCHAPEPRPLVLDDAGRLYLYRYALYQEQLAAELLARLARPERPDPESMRKRLLRLFPRSRAGTGQIDQQRLAAIAAVQGQVTIVSGGPGTGKTYTVARILALLIETELARGGAVPIVQLVAPTGKAAQRLAESLTLALSDPEFAVADAVRGAIPRRAATLHRLLGYQPRTPTVFRHHRGNPILADVVLVDEASMVDLALMSKLVDAIPRQARLIFLGDKDQLASVEAGAILGDICSGHPGAYSVAFADQVAELTGEALAKDPTLPEQGLQDRIVELKQSRRYGSDSGIGRLARAVNDGRVADALAALKSAQDVALHPTAELPYGQLPDELKTLLRKAFAGYARLEPAEKLRSLSRFRLLCAHRRGAQGVEGLNRDVLTFLRAERLLAGEGEFYVGRPILITENDYTQGLYNGDIGVVDKDSSARLRVFFPGEGDGQLLSLSTARLPPHDSVFAMTVHKSQGSEFDTVALLLPQENSRVLTRELIYTAVTRAKTQAFIFGAPDVLAQAIERRIERASGLGELLWQPPGSGPHNGAERERGPR